MVGKCYSIEITMIMESVLLVRYFKNTWHHFYFQWHWITCSLVGVDVIIHCFLFVFLFCTAWRQWAPLFMWNTKRGCHPASDGTQCHGWTQNDATAFLSNEQNELNNGSIVKPTKAQINAGTIYNSPPQTSITIVSLSCILVCSFFNIFVHNFCC